MTLTLLSENPENFAFENFTFAFYISINWLVQIFKQQNI